MMTNKHWNPETVAPPFGRYSHCVEIPANSRQLAIAGQVGVRADGRMEQGIEAQTLQVFRNLESILKQNNMSFEDVYKVGVYLTNSNDVTAYRQAKDQIMGHHAPASTLVVVSALAHPDWLVEVEAYAAAN